MQADDLKDRVLRAFQGAGVDADVTLDPTRRVITLDGIVHTEEARQAARDLTFQALGSGWRIQDNLDVETVLPTDVDDFVGDESRADLMDTAEEVAETGAATPDFTDQATLFNPLAASGASSSNLTDPASTGDIVYDPPTDPVVDVDNRGETRVLNGFGQTAMDDEPVVRSTLDNLPGDESLADAVRLELHSDASTSDLDVDVIVVGGIVHLRGRVEGLEDAENAEAVASRVPGINSVQEELEVASL
jgi:hypothetical protein